ncbi:hypothetical protein [Lewinella sp. IMCC34183]|uniref:hypothetical protein n=1 Tax=Lewinella sp. IMCC34183 TaxID=2248762 RepID=UPI000E24435D|nr:hypothetical protein [Lewinella sp. IMCC34183]
MRHLYLLAFLLVAAPGFADSFRGFLLTRDGYQLTGYLNILQYSPGGNTITFTNDFGDEYVIHPFLVKGFGFNYEGEAMRFVSRRHEGLWYFLQEEVQGRGITLFRLPQGGASWLDDRMLRLFRDPPPEYYFEYGEGKFLPVARMGYKRTLRQFFRQASPALADKIGSRGYRYRNMHEIVAEFNERSLRKRRRL